MRHLVTNQRQFFPNEAYDIVNPKDALNALKSFSIKEYGLDTETYGFDPYTKDLFTVQIGDYDNQYCIDVSTVDINIFKELFEDENNLFILQNAKFDLRFFYHNRIVPKRIYDTFLVEKLLYLGYPSGMIKMALDALTERYLGIKLDKTVRGAIHYEGLSDRVVIYACDDVKYLGKIKELQLKEVEKRDLQNAVKIENEFVRALAYTEYSGLGIDVEKWKAKMAKDLARLNKAKNALDTWVLNYNDPQFIYQPAQGDLFEGFEEKKCSINWNSADQVIPLFNKLGFNLWTKDKDTGELKESVDAKIIEKQKNLSDITPIYLDYSAAFKLVTTYGQNFLDQINPVTGRIHTQFNQLMDTTRLSSGGKDKDTKQDNINFQNIPGDSETRACFIAREGHLLIDSDYSAQEDFIFTELSKEKNLIEFYNDPSGRDGHSFVAKLVYGDILKDIPEKEIKHKFPKLRNISKRGKFALHYGGNGLTVANNLNIPEEEGITFEKKYFNVFTDIKAYFNFIKKAVWKEGYVLISKYTGHKAYIYDWDELKRVEKRMDSSFWDLYRILKPNYNIKEWGQIKGNARNAIIREMVTDYSNDWSINQIAQKEYVFTDNTSKKPRVYKIIPSRALAITSIMKHFFKRKGSSERMALNYPVQGTSAQITKVAVIRFFRYLEKNNLLFIVWIPNQVHDEILAEAPEELAESIAKVLQESMEEAANKFTTVVKLKAVPEIASYWKH